MTDHPGSFLGDVADRVVAWHNRHPLAQRIRRADVQSVGIVQLPFGREPEPAWHAEPVRRGIWQVLFPGRLRRRVWPAFSEDALPEIGVQPLQAFARRHGYLDRPGPTDLPIRVLQLDEALFAAGAKSGASQREERFLVTAAVDAGMRRPRIVLGQGRVPPVLGQRLWSMPRLAALGGGLLLAVVIGIAALWLRAMAPRTAESTPGAPSASSPAQVLPPASAPARGTASAVWTPASAPPPAAIEPPVAPPVAPVPGSAAAVSAPTQPRPVASAAAPTRSAVTSAAPSASAPAPASAADARAGPAPARATAAATAASATGASAPIASAAASGPTAASAAESPLAFPLPEVQFASQPLVRLRPDLVPGRRKGAASGVPETTPGPAGTSRPPPTASRPAATAFYALVSRPMRSRAEAQALLERLRSETQRINHPTATQTALVESTDGWRVTWWPFTHPRQAENARAAMASRRFALEVVAF
jgi:hypothetical protein